MKKKLVSELLALFANLNNYRTNVGDNEELLELGQRIKEEGLRTPIRLGELPDGTLVILGGHRRTLAAEAAGIEQLNCTIEKVGSSEEALLIQMRDNNDRAQDNFVSRAKLFQRLMNNGFSIGEIVSATIFPTGIVKKEARVNYIKKHLQLMTLPEKIIELCEMGKFKETATDTQALLLIGISDNAAEMIYDSLKDRNSFVSDVKIKEFAAQYQSRISEEIFNFEFNNENVHQSSCVGCEFIVSTDGFDVKCANQGCLSIKQSLIKAEQAAMFDAFLEKHSIAVKDRNDVPQLYNLQRIDDIKKLTEILPMIEFVVKDYDNIYLNLYVKTKAIKNAVIDVADALEKTKERALSKNLKAINKVRREAIRDLLPKKINVLKSACVNMYEPVATFMSKYNKEAIEILVSVVGENKKAADIISKCYKEKWYTAGKMEELQKALDFDYVEFVSLITSTFDAAKSLEFANFDDVQYLLSMEEEKQILDAENAIELIDINDLEKSKKDSLELAAEKVSNLSEAMNKLLEFLQIDENNLNVIDVAEALSKSQISVDDLMDDKWVRPVGLLRFIPKELKDKKDAFVFQLMEEKQVLAAAKIIVQKAMELNIFDNDSFEEDSEEDF